MLNIDSNMSRLCNRLMSIAQNAHEAIQDVITELEWALEDNQDREDIKALLDEVKHCKAAESNNWIIANNWSEHFDGIGTEEESDEATEDEDGE